jgi:prepilin-type N-terminal cleavage/methylation domain-containing protein
MRRRAQSPAGLHSTPRAFTLVELLIVLAVIAALAALLLPVLTAARRASARPVCTSNLRQLGMAVRMYMQDYSEARPDRLHVLVPAYVSDKRLLQCPDDDTGNYAFLVGDLIVDPPETTPIPTSYNYFRWGDRQWSALEALGPKAGFIVDYNHGEYLSSLGPRAHPPAKGGKILRLGMDGSARWLVLPRRGCNIWWCVVTYNPGEPVPPNPGSG